MRKCPNLCQSAKGWGWRASALWWCAQGVGKPSSSPALEWKGVGKPSLRPVLVCKGCPSLKRMPAFVTSTNHIRSDHCYNQSSHATSSMGLKGRALLWLMWITSSKRSALSLTCRTYATFMHPPPPNRRGNPNKSAEQIGGPIFRQNSFPLTWIAVPGPKHTFPLVVVQLESCGNSKCLSIFEK